MTSACEGEPNSRNLDAQLLGDLWVFRAAAQFSSITAAANSIGVTQPAVSRRVLRLEARLGFALFARQKGRIALTEEGREIMDAISEVALVLNKALGRIGRSDLDQPGGNPLERGRYAYGQHRSV